MITNLNLLITITRKEKKKKRERESLICENLLWNKEVVLAEVTTDAPAPNAMCASMWRELRMIPVIMSPRTRESTIMRCQKERSISVLLTPIPKKGLTAPIITFSSTGGKKETKEK